MKVKDALCQINAYCLNRFTSAIISHGSFRSLVVTTQHPLDFVLWQGVRSAESVAYGLYVRIRASQQRS